MQLYHALSQCGLAVAAPKGSFYVYPSFHPYTKQLQALGIKTSLELSRWLIEECGVAALPGSAFGEDDGGLAGGRYRLRMATSYLYFQDVKERYTRGYEILEKASRTESASMELPLLAEAIDAVGKAVLKLKAVEV
jgi:aspartate aminotransferase